ncbi:hypothetical protein [Streptomyces violascens]|uniref:hypothetical protein n=1 Tax=Streptomyces violascens TaxID=67381 RepID=UPI0036904003
MTNNDMSTGDGASGGREPTVPPPARQTRRYMIVPPLRVPVPDFLRSVSPKYLPMAGSSALSYAIVAGRAPEDPHRLWALVVLSIAIMVCGTWNQHRQ